MLRCPSALLAGLAASALALAQGADPMRPPEGAATDGGSVAPAAQSGVQTVIVRPQGKSVAVINGKQVSVGDRLGDKRVVKISEREIVLNGDSGREVIKVMPAMEKIPVKAASGARALTGGTREGSEAK
jgi:hypothetical protein